LGVAFIFIFICSLLFLFLFSSYYYFNCYSLHVRISFLGNLRLVAILVIPGLVQAVAYFYFVLLVPGTGTARASAHGTSNKAAGVAFQVTCVTTVSALAWLSLWTDPRQVWLSRALSRVLGWHQLSHTVHKRKA
jgi:hypothetical protein